MRPAELAGMGRRSREIYDLCKARRLSVFKVNRTWRVRGPGVDLLVTDLRYVTEADIRPVALARRSILNL